MARWTDQNAQETVIERFRKAFPDKPAEGEKPVAFLIVRTMLLTGFDAPIEQVMYLDRRIKEADLLQAIARVNRTVDGKTAGFVVDYAGISHHLQSAMEAYAVEDAEGAGLCARSLSARGCWAQSGATSFRGLGTGRYLPCDAPASNQSLGTTEGFG